MLARNYADLAVIYVKLFASMDEFLKLYDSVSLKDLQKIVNKLLKGGLHSRCFISRKVERIIAIIIKSILQKIVKKVIIWAI
ncbi:MAG: hypothetical protein LBB06_00105 [Endomicrobium sp.]|jgi:hypothetical protein|nr:hypothetical protein [Endomicrobium sp.]